MRQIAKLFFLVGGIAILFGGEAFLRASRAESVPSVVDMADVEVSGPPEARWVTATDAGWVISHAVSVEEKKFGLDMLERHEYYVPIVGGAYRKELQAEIDADNRGHRIKLDWSRCRMLAKLPTATYHKMFHPLLEEARGPEEVVFGRIYSLAEPVVVMTDLDFRGTVHKEGVSDELADALAKEGCDDPSGIAVVGYDENPSFLVALGLFVGAFAALGIGLFLNRAFPKPEKNHFNYV